MEKEFKGTVGLWHEKNGIIFDDYGNKVPSKSHFSASGRLTTEELFGEDEEYIKAKYNDRLKSLAPELLLALRDLVWLIENHALDEELSESINLRAKKVINKALNEIVLG